MNLLSQGVNIEEKLNPSFGGSTGPGFGAFILIIVNNVIAFAGLTCFFLILFGGFSVMMGAGNNDPQRAAQGKQTVTYAIIGFLIVFTAYWIVKGIEILTGISITENTL